MAIITNGGTFPNGNMHMYMGSKHRHHKAYLASDTDIKKQTNTHHIGKASY
jgi:hypothetical protein